MGQRTSRRAHVSVETRRHVAGLADAAGAAGDPVGWFERLYADAGYDHAAIPWADGEPNPNLVEWTARERLAGEGRPAVVVGCGLGHDAEHLAALGFDTTAFDVSPTAVEWARREHPGSAVRYAVADLLEPPPSWVGRFALVAEIYTVQSLPPAGRRRAIESLAQLVAPGGRLLVVCRGRDDDEPVGRIPWPLSPAELSVLEDAGLDLVRFEDYPDRHDDPPQRRFRVEYRRPVSGSPRDRRE